MKKILILILGAVFLSSCGVLHWRYQGHGPMMGSGWPSNRQFESNGERIYYTAINEKGERISYRGESSFGRMVGGGALLSCVSCHGRNARGGVHTMHMDVMDAPDIRYSALSGETDEHGVDDHTDEHKAYDLDDFRQAVVEGKHPDGDALDLDMPRWQIDDEDLTDLFEFLKSLP